MEHLEGISKVATETHTVLSLQMEIIQIFLIKVITTTIRVQITDLSQNPMINLQKLLNKIDPMQALPDSSNRSQNLKKISIQNPMKIC